MSQTKAQLLSPSGNVGIGTDNPLTKLHTDGTVFAGSSGFSGSLYGGVRIAPNNGNGQAGGVIYGGVHNDTNTAIFLRRGYDATLDTIDFNSYGGIRFFTNGALASQTEKLRIDSNGNVGIGTDNPDGQLTIKKQILNSDTISNTVSHLSLVSDGGGSNPHQSVIHFGPRNASTNSSPAAIAAIASGNTASDLAFYVNSNNNYSSTPNTEVLRITSTGNVGIGTDNPSQKLEVYNSSSTPVVKISGPTSGSSAIEFYASTTKNGALLVNSSGFLIAADNSNPITFNAGGSEKFRITSGGGITFNGDTAAANALDDYEEGTLNWKLQRSDSYIGTNSASNIKYSKIGNRVFVSGYLYTQDTGGTTGVYVHLRDNSNTSNPATLPYTPNHEGGFTVTGTRTIDDNYRNISVTFMENSTTVYVYTDDGNNSYNKNTNNVLINSAQTHLVLIFNGSYTTNS